MGNLSLASAAKIVSSADLSHHPPLAIGMSLPKPSKQQKEQVCFL